MLQFPLVHAGDFSKQMPREQFFFSQVTSALFIKIKTGKNFRKKVKLDMATSEHADEVLPTFSLGMDFLTPKKEPRERENKTINGFVSFHNSSFLRMNSPVIF